MSLINRVRRNRAATVRERSARARPNPMKTGGVVAERACAPAPPNRNTQSRKTWRAHSCVPCRHSWRHVLGPQAPHQPDPTVAPRSRPSKKANKRSTNFPESAQTCPPRRKKQQSCRLQPAVKTPNHLPSIKSRTSPSPAATTRNLIKTRRSQPNALRRAVMSRAASHNSISSARPGRP